MSNDRVTSKCTAVTLLDDKEYFVRPLSLKKYKMMLVEMQEMADIDPDKPVDPAMVDRMTKVCHEALLPVHPDLEFDKLEDLIDIETAVYIINVAMAGDKKSDA